MRENWRSKAGFIFAALGSAIGLGSIWRFPYIIGENGGSAFLFFYMVFLFLIGLPVLLSEISLGRKTQKNPFGAMKACGGKTWGWAGKGAILTGLLISSFYSVIAGWTLGYFFLSLSGRVSSISSFTEAHQFFTTLSTSSFYSIFLHFVFLSLCLWILISGVKKGIEAKSKILMPLLFLVLFCLAVYAFMLPGGRKSLQFLFSLQWEKIHPKILIAALGQAFFTLSLGQGTMITYGSYLSSKESIISSCIPVVFLNLLTSLLMGVAVYGMVFSFPTEVTAGPSLIFETLPVVFSQLPLGGFWASLFFFLVVVAALTSEISALEPAISYLVDEKKFTRKKATFWVVLLAFFLGIFSALSFTPSKGISSYSFYEVLSYISVNLLVPLGGFCAVLMVGWQWPKKQVLEQLCPDFKRNNLFFSFLFLCLRYIAPVCIFLIFLDLLFPFLY